MILKEESPSLLAASLGLQVPSPKKYKNPVRDTRTISKKQQQQFYIGLQ